MRILFCELKKAVCQKGFPAAALAIGALCFSANAYFDETMKPYTVLEAMVSLDRGVIRADTSLSAYMLFKGALTSGYTALFLPLVAAFPFMFSFCAERDSGMIRFTVARTERRKYYLAKFLAAMISAGEAAVCGAAVYGLVLKLAFPSILSYQVDAETLDWIMPYGYAGTLTLLFVRFFVLGALYALPAFVISSFCKDVYVILCVPFLLFYMWDRLVWYAQSKMPEFADTAGLFAPGAIAWAVGGQPDGSGWKVIVINILYFIAAFALFALAMNSHTDRGE